MGMISKKLLKPRPQELGKIKIGGLGEKRRAQSGREYQLPVKFDHFEVRTRQRGADGNFLRDESIHAKLGPKPQELPGILMYPTPEENFHAEMVQYDGRTKIVTCDGEERLDLKTAQCTACPRLKDPDFACGCKPYMRLHIQLWDSPVLGYHVFRSTGWETTNNIQTALQEIYERFGTLYHAPVKLVIYPATVSYDEGGKSKTSQAYMVGLTLAASMEEVAQQMVGAKRLMQATQHELKAISGQVMEEQAERDREEAADIAAEYFPDAGIQASVRSQEKLDALKEQLGGDVQEADYEIVEDDDAQGESGSGPNGGDPGDSSSRESGPADADTEDDALKRLKTDLANAMAADAPHLLNEKDQRTQWVRRVLGDSTKSGVNGCSEFELNQLLDAMRRGDTAPDAVQEATTPSTPFDDDEAEAMPA